MSERIAVPGAQEFKVSKPQAETHRVGISSDDGPNIDNLESVLGILKDHGATATFFWIVDFAKKFQEKDRVVFGRFLHQLRDDGHEIGLHAPRDYKPTLKTRLISAFTKDELRSAIVDLEGITDMDVQYYFPHLFFQPLSVIHAKQLGLRTPLRDPIHYADAAAPVEKQVEKFSSAQSGNIIVFHDGISLYRQVTHVTEVMPQVLRNLRKPGNGLSKISDMPRFISI